LQREIIAIDGITKRYGSKNSSYSILALDNVSFTMHSGANSLLGPNGAGKSTLIKILLGYICCDAGDAQVLGYDIRTEVRELKKHIGYMPENDCIISGLNAVKQVSLLGKISGLPKAEAMQRAHETLQYVGLDEARYREVKEFSTGMRQRLKLAGALVNDPELLILDEPTNGLDPKGRQEMIDLIYEISHDHGMNVLVSSHLLLDVEATCDFATILNNGRVIQQGSIRELTGQESRKQQTKTMRVRIKGDFNEFLTGLKKQGLTFEVVDKVIQIPYNNENPSETIMEVAYNTGIQIRSMSPRHAVLEDVFVHSVERDYSNESDETKKSEETIGGVSK
jgi:ABC-2 type transport system ATP-binding protein